MRPTRNPLSKADIDSLRARLIGTKYDPRSAAFEAFIDGVQRTLTQFNAFRDPAQPRLEREQDAKKMQSQVKALLDSLCLHDESSSLSSCLQSLLYPQWSSKYGHFNRLHESLVDQLGDLDVMLHAFFENSSPARGERDTIAMKQRLREHVARLFHAQFEGAATSRNTVFDGLFKTICKLQKI